MVLYIHLYVQFLFTLDLKNLQKFYSYAQTHIHTHSQDVNVLTDSPSGQSLPRASVGLDIHPLDSGYNGLHPKPRNGPDVIG